MADEMQRPSEKFQTAFDSFRTFKMILKMDSMGCVMKQAETFAKFASNPKIYARHSRAGGNPVLETSGIFKNNRK